MNKEELHTLIEQSQPNICQIVAYKDNKEVYSDTWNNYKDTDCVHIMSATKSIMALLFGIAIDKGQMDPNHLSDSRCGHRRQGTLPRRRFH